MPLASNVYVPLPTAAAEALRELARREFRHPRDQARKLLVEGLQRAGALPAEPADSRHADPAAGAPARAARPRSSSVATRPTSRAAHRRCSTS